MMSNIPINLGKVKKEEIDREILRAGIIAELDAVNLYEQLAAMAENEGIKKILLDIAKEEKTHVGEFQALLLKLDKEQERELVRERLFANHWKRSHEEFREMFEFWRNARREIQETENADV